MSTEEESPTNPLISSTRCKVNDLCRLCLTSAEHRLEIFGKVGKMSNISEIISSLFNLQLMQHDNWPQSICIPCYQKLVEFQTFYSTVKATEATLIGLCGEWGPPDSLFEEGEEEKFSQSKEYAERFEKQDEASSPEHSIDYPDLLVKVKEEEVEVSVDVLELDESVDELNNEEQDKTDDAEDESSAAAATKKKPSKPKKKTKAATAKEKKSPKKNIPQVSQYVSERRKKYDREVTKYVKLTCDACEVNFEIFDDLKKHFRDVHNEEGYVNCCNFTLRTRGALMEHVLYHKDPSKYNCKECGKSFKARARLSEHLDTHVPDELRQFKCDHCPRKFAKQRGLRYHAMIHVPRDQWVHKCPECNKPFPSVYLMRSHVRLSHEEGQKKICEVCARVFTTNQTFLAHKRVHLENQPSECDQCGRIFKDQYRMKRHRRTTHNIQTGVFPCDLCGKEFKTSLRMVAHKRHVHSDKSFKCALCEKEFKREINYKEHVATHTGLQTLYQCKFCDKMFNSNANRYVHQKRIHPEEWEEQRQKKLEKSSTSQAT